MQAIEQAYNRYVLRSDPDLGTAGMKAAIPDMHVEFNRYRSRACIPDPEVVDDGAPISIRGAPGDSPAPARRTWACDAAARSFRPWTCSAWDSC
jgi:hypothetical protein